MIQIRRSLDRGHAIHGWLDSYHTFSFADFYDPKFMGFRALRVINQDVINGGTGFPTHPHRDMEIITYMIRGDLAHRDSMGHQAKIERGEVQYMSAGTGITHSEFNANLDSEAELLQIWIIPPKEGLPTRYGQKSFLEKFNENKLVKVLSPDGSEDSLQIYQNANLYVGWLKAQELQLSLENDRHGWLQVVKGEIEIEGEKLGAGDAAALSKIKNPKLKVLKDSEFLFFDLE
jgi:quercetin 2,3-dioxygenase